MSDSTTVVFVLCVLGGLAFAAVYAYQSRRTIPESRSLNLDCYPRDIQGIIMEYMLPSGLDLAVAIQSEDEESIRCPYQFMPTGGAIDNYTAVSYSGEQRQPT